MLTGWYKFLDSKVSGVLPKLILDQTLFAPCIVSSFFFTNGVLQGQPIDQVVAKIKRDIPGTMVANWAVWPAAMFLNFRYVPAELRVLTTSFIALLWNTYLSTVGNKH